MNNENPELRENNLKSTVKKCKYCYKSNYADMECKNTSKNLIVRNKDVYTIVKGLQTNCIIEDHMLEK